MDRAEHRTWWQRNWQWVVACSGIVVLAALLVGAVLLVVYEAITSSDAYRDGLAAARGDARVVEALGEPIEPGTLVMGTINVNGPSGHAELAIPLSGPKGRATLYVTADESAGRWTMTVLEVAVRGREDRIHLLKEPAKTGAAR